jgi:hypothetical protein
MKHSIDAHGRRYQTPRFLKIANGRFVRPALFCPALAFLVSNQGSDLDTSLFQLGEDVTGIRARRTDHQNLHCKDSLGRLHRNGKMEKNCATFSAVITPMERAAYNLAQAEG